MPLPRTINLGLRRLGCRNRRLNSVSPRYSASGLSGQAACRLSRKRGLASPTQRPGSGVNQSSRLSHPTAASSRSSSSTSGLFGFCFPDCSRTHSWPFHCQRLLSDSLLARSFSRTVSLAISKTNRGVALCVLQSCSQFTPLLVVILRSLVSRRCVSLDTGALSILAQFPSTSCEGELRRRNTSPPTRASVGSPAKNRTSDMVQVFLSGSLTSCVKNRSDFAFSK